MTIYLNEKTLRHYKEQIFSDHYASKIRKKGSSEKKIGFENVSGENLNFIVRSAGGKGDKEICVPAGGICVIEENGEINYLKDFYGIYIFESEIELDHPRGVRGFSLSVKYSVPTKEEFELFTESLKSSNIDGNKISFIKCKKIPRTDMLIKLPRAGCCGQGIDLDFALSTPWGKSGEKIPRFAKSGDGLIYSDLLDDFYFASQEGAVFEYDMLYKASGLYADFRDVWAYNITVPLPVLTLGARIG